MNNILKSFETLSENKLITFGYFCCEHLFENYIFFSKKYDWGNIGLLSNSLSVIKSHILGSNYNITNIEKLIESVVKEIPDSTDFSSILCSFAIDASNSILETLSFIKKKEFQSIVDISTFCTDTVDMYIQESDDMSYDDPLFEDKIKKNRLMISEINRQIHLLKLLEKADKVDENQFRKLKMTNDETEKINLLVLGNAQPKT